MDEKQVVLRYVDPKTGETAQYPVHRGVLEELAKDNEDEGLSNFAEWILQRLDS